MLFNGCAVHHGGDGDGVGVEDGNAYMLGGIAGHAGLFSNAHDLSALMADLMFENTLLSADTVRVSTTPRRALISDKLSRIRCMAYMY